MFLHLKAVAVQPLFVFFVKGMSLIFKPKFIFDNITDITIEFLKENSIKGLLVDVDNTLTIAHANPTLKKGVDEWLLKMQESGIGVIILSNAKKERVQPFAEKIGLNFIGLSLKPLPFNYIKGVRRLNLKNKHTAIVGDQLFTDILGGKLAGVKTILVTDITPEDNISFKIRRSIEKKILSR